MSPLFQKAERRKAKLRLAIDGPSGSGKTYSALLIAKGIARGDLAKVAVIDTERGSASLYSDVGAYSVLDFEPPYSPERYMKAIAAAEAEGFEVIVIDSLTHAWSGEGGLLDYVDRVAKAKTSGNSFAAWKEGTPLQARLTDAILKSPCHVIVTLRTKTEWVIEENEKGKKQPRKIGLAPDQRKDLEYDYTLVLDLSREHIATASKDRTGIFDDRYEVPTPAMGAELLAWLESGADGDARASTLPADEEEPAARPSPAQTQSREIAEASPAAPVVETISEEERQALLTLIKAKGYEVAAVERSLRNAGVCSDGLASVPESQLAHVMTTIAGLKQKPKAETQPQEPVGAAPQADVDPDGFDEVTPEEWSEEPQPAPAPIAKPAAPMVNRATMHMLDVKVKELASLGVKDASWQKDMAPLTGGKTKFEELTQDEALAVNDHWTVWIGQLRAKRKAGAAA
jgi:hypothetical protein